MGSVQTKKGNLPQTATLGNCECNLPWCNEWQEWVGKCEFND